MERVGIISIYQYYGNVGGYNGDKDNNDGEGEDVGVIYRYCGMIFSMYLDFIVKFYIIIIFVVIISFGVREINDNLEVCVFRFFGKVIMVGGGNFVLS